MLKTKYELLDMTMRQCAVDLNCDAEDFKKNENVIVTPANLKGRRYFIPGIFFFRMITFGKNAVIAADERIRPYLKDYVKGKKGYELFEEPHQREIDMELKKYGKQLWPSTHVFLPDMKIKPLDDIAKVKWFEEGYIPPLYSDGRFHNAIQYKIKPHRPDVLVVASYDEDRITGMAGASADCKDLWQIGIDVLPEYRGKRLGTYLVTLLKNEIIRRGYIPYYSTSQSNIFSQNIALNAGFFPAWAEAYSAEPREE